RPAKPAQRNDLLLLRFAQDIHRRRVNPPSQSMSWVSYSIGRFSGVHVWPDLSVHRGSHIPVYAPLNIRSPPLVNAIEPAVHTTQIPLEARGHSRSSVIILMAMYRMIEPRSIALGMIALALFAIREIVFISRGQTRSVCR